MERWQEVVLIVVAVAAFVMSLYSLLFMVPFKRFRRFIERIDSLGGGMKGIETHVEGVRDEIKARLAELEEGTRKQLAETRQGATAAVDKLLREHREVQRELERLRKDVQSLQAELRASAADTMKVGQSCEALTKQLQQLRNDFDALDVELRESVRQLVAESLSTVESTVLSALDAVQEEILYGTSGSTGPGKPMPPRQEPARPSPIFSAPERQSRDNIIPVGPLFMKLRSAETERDAERRAAAEDKEKPEDEESDKPADKEKQ
jgi:uncharacterized protein YoxC